MRHSRNRQTGHINAYKQDIIDKGVRKEDRGRIYYERALTGKKGGLAVQRVRAV
jgi:hypothetical protein